jgi:hypothetical protein
MTMPASGFAAIAPTFKVAMLGPSGVGKTSILVSMLDDAPRALAHQPVLLRERDDVSQLRLQSRREQLRGGIANHSFDSDALPGDRNEAYYQLELRVHDSDDVRINIDFLDYPGGWLVPSPDGAEDHRPHWDEVRRFIIDADMILIPIDAVLLMEARTALQRKAVVAHHRIAAVEDIVEEWATVRQGTGRPSLLVLAPVKTETYLADNGGLNDHDRELQTAVTRAYDGVLKRFAYRATAAETLYCPVDTLGCVELTRLDWRPDGSGNFQPRGRFLVRPGQPEISIRGAADIMIAICRVITSYTGEVAKQQAQDYSSRKDEADAQHREMTVHLVPRIANWITGRTRAVERDRTRFGWQSVQYMGYAEQLAKAVAVLATTKYQRARRISVEEVVR